MSKHLYTLGWALLGWVFGVLAVAMAWYFAVGAAVCFFLGYASERGALQIDHGLDGMVIRVRMSRLWFSGRARRKQLKRDTLALVTDIHTFVRDRPSPIAETMGQHFAVANEMQQASDEATKQAIWGRYTESLAAQSDRDRQELGQRFAGRVKYVTDAYVERGLLPPEKVPQLLWHCQSTYWISGAASDLEALALRL